MNLTYLTTNELSSRIKYDPRTIREQMKDSQQECTSYALHLMLFS